MKLVIATLASIALLAPARAQERFRDHGVASHAVESRGVTPVHDRLGRNLVVSLNNDHGERGWMLMTDIDTGITEQVYFPAAVDHSFSLAAPFASYVSKQGRFYTGIGGVLMEFEPATKEWLYHGRPSSHAPCFIHQAFAEGPDGRIYAGTTEVGSSSCHLGSYDPKTGQTTDHGQMDPAEKALRFLAFDAAGWVYCGIGNARGNIVALNPQTGEKRQIPTEAERTQSTGWVFPGKDGKVYGTAAGKNWRLFGGVGEAIDRTQRAPEQPTGVIGWKHTTGSFPDGRQLTAYSLQDGWMEIHEPKTGQTQRLTFSYQAAGGMGFTSLAPGPDSNLYGSTCHPMRFIRFDPRTQQLTDLGSVVEVGNFCAMAIQGKWLAAASYSSGIMHLYDPAAPFNGGQGEAPNPREVARWPRDLCRPRTCVAYPDGKHLLMAGYATYGLVGGGLGIYDLETSQAALLTHTELIPYHSTITLKVLPDGDLVGGTDIAAPGGGHVKGKEGVLYLLDFKTRKVRFQTVPVPGATFIKSLEVGPHGRVYGLAAGGKFFVFDVQKREVIQRDDWAAHGREVGITRGPRGKLYALLEKAIIEIEPQALECRQLATPPAPATAGPVILDDGRLYFASRPHLWSYGLE